MIRSTIASRVLARWAAQSRGSAAHYTTAGILARLKFGRDAGRLIYAFGTTDLDKLSRMGRTFGVISAYRGNLTKKKNQERHGQLMADLQKAGYRPQTLKSQWTDMEAPKDPETGEPPPPKHEKSLLVPNIDFDTLHKLGKKYEQDAVLYKDKSGSIGIYFKDNTAVMAYNPKGKMDVSKSTDRKKEYSRGRSVSFGLQMVDRKFPYHGKPITQEQIQSEVGDKNETKSDAADDKSEERDDFLKDRGDQKVPNPNQKSRDRYPKVKIKSLPWKEQKRYYDEWREKHAGLTW